MLRSTEATFDWLDIENGMTFHQGSNKVTNDAISRSSSESDAGIACSDPVQISLGQCFISGSVSGRESELTQLVHAWSPTFPENDIFRSEGISWDTCIGTPPTSTSDQSLNSTWPWQEKLGNLATEEVELLDDEYQNVSCATEHKLTRTGLTIPLSKGFGPLSTLSGSPSGKSRSATPDSGRQSCSPSSSNKKRKPKEQARRAHAKVERRYRENLNLKIVELQECLNRTKQTYPRHDMQPELMVNTPLDQGVNGMGKVLCKADILSEAIRYINETEVEIRHISNELHQLRNQCARV